MTLNGLNIRKGLELEEVKVYDIFLPKTEADGNIIAQDIYTCGWKGYLQNNPEQTIESIFGKDDAIIYFSSKTINKISDTLTAYVFDSYVAFLDDDNNVSAEKNVEIEFVNTSTLDFSEFCKNVMEAQAYTGNFADPTIKYSFIGVGNFTMAQYAELHNLIVYSRLHMLDFFVFYKNILSSIGFFLSGLFENDVKQQKEYINTKEYNAIIRECKRQRKIIVKKMEELGKDFEE